MIDLQEGIDYNFVERAESEFYSIRLLTGKWAGVIYTYGRVSIKEDKRRDQATLSFDYRIEDTEGTPYVPSVLEASDGFRNMIGDVLANILSTSEIQIGKDGSKSADDNRKGTNS